MRGGGRLTCCSTAWMQQSSYAPPRRICEAAVALSATRMPKSFYLPPRRECEAAVNLLAASPLRSLEATVAYLLPRCGCEAALFLPASWMPKSSYLPPRRGCEAAVAFLRHGGR